MEEENFITGSKKLLQFGYRLARANLVLFIVYDIIVIIGIVMGQGILAEPYLAIAEILTVTGAPLLVLLMVAIHACAPKSSKVYSLTAFGWMVLLAGTTAIVHLVNLTLWRQLPAEQRIDYVRFLGWEWPSLMFAIELVAWHLFFGLAVFFAAFAFTGAGKEKIVKQGLMLTGMMCIVGLTGPIIGDLRWRIIGIVGYGMLFPVTCIYMAGVFKHARVAQGAESNTFG